MTSALRHRGPDGYGTWVSDDARVGLGHTRLSIIDLSPAGAQPMVSASGRYIVTFNGEIYNFKVLRFSLEQLGMSFRSHSDTEVLLSAFEAWGVKDTLTRLNGMFAFAVWDSEDKKLFLARDRMGIKPLYYTECNGKIMFSSELKPIAVYESKVPEISCVALTEYLRLGYVPAPLSIFDGVFKLQPGHVAEFHEGTMRAPEPYWQLEKAVQFGRSNQICDAKEAADTLERAVLASVERQMVSDVPLGAFLSGGVDSTLVTALMQTSSPTKVKTFSIGFYEQDYNEAQHAAAVAHCLNTDHTELYITDGDALSVIPELPDIYDEPFADVSQIPTYLLSRLAREDVTVALSGDGGDELFAGYDRYATVSEFWKRLKQVPFPARKLISVLGRSVPPAAWDTISRVLPPSARYSLPGQKIHQIGRVLGSSDLSDIQRALISQWPSPESIMASECKKHATNCNYTSSSNHLDLSDIERQMVWDSKGYLADDILTKVDRATMRAGLEARVPLLDEEVVQLSWSLPIDMKLRGNESKWLLKEVLYRYVPKELMKRPKMGFGIPLDSWLRGPLREWATSNLSSNLLHEQGFFDPDQVNFVWRQHLNCKVNFAGPIWTLLMFQLWLEKVKRWV